MMKIKVKAGTKEVELTKAELLREITHALHTVREYGHPSGWKRKFDLWTLLPPLFYWHTTQQEGSPPEHFDTGWDIMIKLFSDDLIVVQAWVDTNWVFFFGYRKSRYETFRLFIHPSDCKVNRDGDIRFEFRPGQKVTIGQDHVAWPRILIDPDRYRSVSAIQYLIRPSNDKINPFTPLLRSRNRNTRSDAEAVNAILTEAYASAIAQLRQP